MDSNFSLSRRTFLRASAVVGAGLAAVPLNRGISQEPAVPAVDGFSLPPLPYAYSALEPHLDARTMEIHHTKHHAAYINNLNLAVKGTPWSSEPVDKLVARLKEVPESIRAAVQNHGGGHANHSLFWTVMGPKGGGQPGGTLAAAIDRDLGGWEKFKSAFTDAATKRFGSGWAWLSIGPGKKLIVESSSNQDSPLSIGHTPILGIDVWEHAYYLHYQNRRPDYIEAFFQVINWENVAGRFQSAL